MVRHPLLPERTRRSGWNPRLSFSRKRLSVDERHDVIEERVSFARIEQRQDMGVLEIGGGGDLLHDAFAATGGPPPYASKLAARPKIALIAQVAQLHCPTVPLSHCPSVRLSACPPVRLSACTSVRLSPVRLELQLHNPDIAFPLGDDHVNGTVRSDVDTLQVEKKAFIVVHNYWKRIGSRHWCCPDALPPGLIY